MASFRNGLIPCTAICALLVSGDLHAQLRPLGDLTPGSADSFFGTYKIEMDVVHEGGSFLFHHDVATCSLFSTDGSAAATLAFDGCVPFSVLQINSMHMLDGRFLFRGTRYSPSISVRMAASNGTAAGTTELDFGGHINVSKPQPWPAFPGWALLAVEKAGGVHEAWITDGTQANTRILVATGIAPQFVSMQDRRLVILGNGVWTKAETAATPAPTPLVPAEVPTNARLFAGENPKPANKLYFTATSAGFGNELWVTDLTSVGTVRLTDFIAGPADTVFNYGRSMLQDGGHYFTYQDRLYRSDGTGPGTLPMSPAATVTVPPLLALDSGVVIGTLLQNDGRRLFKHRPATPASFATFTGILGNTTQATLFYGPFVWPNEALYAVSPFAFANIQQVVPAAVPTDAALGALIAGQRDGDEMNSFLGDTLLDGGSNAIRLWRRGQTTASTEHALSPSLAVTHMSYVGGSVMFGAWDTPVAGREAYVWDLAPHGVPVCNFPNKKVADNTPAGRNDSLFLRSDGILATNRLLDLRVHLDIPHAFVGDLIVDLLHVPSGRTARLFDRPGVPAATFGCQGNDLDVMMDDAAALSTESCSTAGAASPLPAFERLTSLTPVTPLGSFFGADPVGEWRLTVSDNVGGDIGGITGWCLDMSLGPLPVDLFEDGFETAP